MSDNCIFCRIAMGETGSEIIAESSHAMAFRDINPQAPVHILVIPRDHIPGLKDLGRGRCELLEEVFSLIDELAISEGVAQTGYRVVVNQGEDGGQEVGHLHFHLLGGRFMKWPPG